MGHRRQLPKTAAGGVDREIRHGPSLCPDIPPSSVCRATTSRLGGAACRWATKDKRALDCAPAHSTEAADPQRKSATG